MPLQSHLVDYLDKMRRHNPKEPYLAEIIERVVSGSHNDFFKIHKYLKSKVHKGETFPVHFYYPLANLALRNEDHKLALSLANTLIKENPNHIDTPSVYLVCAEVYRKSDKLKQAYVLLKKKAIEKYPNGRETEQLKRYKKEYETELRSIEKMKSVKDTLKRSKKIN